MTTSQTGSLSDYLRQALRAWKQDDRSDVELLSAFADTRDDQAFATLVSRHGPLVWGVCQRVLHNRQDAEDAFQATFLVLARHAGQVGLKGHAGHYLYGVAQRTAWNLRKSIARRHHQERLRATMRPAMFSEDEGSDADLLSLLDEEVQQLPEYYRLPLVLYRFEKRTYEEVARLLGCHTGTAQRRVAHAQELLRERLTRRGVSLAGVSLAAVLGGARVASGMPPRLLHETVRAALAFVNNSLGPTRSVCIAQGVLQAMASNKAMLLWGVTVTALLCLGGVGLRLVAQPVPPALVQEAVPAPAELQVPAPPKPRLDYYGDPLPEGALARIGTLRFRPDRWNGQGEGAFLPDGKTLVSVHGTDTVHFWDVATGKERRRFQAQGIKGASRVRVSPDGRLLAVGGGGEVEVWDLTTEPPQLRWKHKAEGIVPCLAFAPDGGTLAFGDVQWGENPSQKVHLRDAKTGKQRQTLDSTDSSPQGLAFSPNGKLLVIWNNYDGQSVLCLWDVAAGKRRHSLSGPGPFAGFAPDSRTLATRLERGIALWDVAAGKRKRLISVENELFTVSAAFLPDGTLLGTHLESGGSRLRFWDPETGKQRRPGLEAPGMWLDNGFNLGGHLSPDGKLLASVGRNTIQVWDVETGKVRGPEGIVNGVHEIAFSPNEDRLATYGAVWPMPSVQLWQTHTGVPGPQLKVDSPRYLFFRLGYARDHRLYTLRATLSPTRGEVVDLVSWDTRAGKAVEVPQSVQQAAGKLQEPGAWAVAPKGQLLALRQDDDVTLYELATGKEVRRLRGLANIKDLVFSADGQSLAGYGGQVFGDHALAVWDVSTGRLRLPPLTVKLISRDWSPAFTFSPDGRWLAAYTEETEEGQPSTKAVQVLEVASGKAGLRLLTDPEQVFSLAWSPDGRVLATGYQNSTVQLWEASSGRKRHALTGHRGAVTALAFSADGSRLASGSQDTTALVWDLRRLQTPAIAAADLPKTEELLDALSKADAAAAYHAIGQLAAAPGGAVAELRKRLQPAAPPDAKQVQRWLEGLDSKDFKARSHAFAELAKHVDSVEAALRKALDEGPTLERRQRLEKLLERLDPSGNPVRLFVLRGVETLERIGTPEARKALQELAQLEGYLVGREAQTALQRLAQTRPDVGGP